MSFAAQSCDFSQPSSSSSSGGGGGGVSTAALHGAADFSRGQRPTAGRR